MTIIICWFRKFGYMAIILTKNCEKPCIMGCEILQKNKAFKRKKLRFLADIRQTECRFFLVRETCCCAGHNAVWRGVWAGGRRLQGFPRQTKICFRYRVFIKYCVFFFKNSRKFATSPSPALGCYWLYKKLPANRSDCTLALRWELWRSLTAM